MYIFTDFLTAFNLKKKATSNIKLLQVLKKRDQIAKWEYI